MLEKSDLRFAIRSFRGRERVSKPYAFTVQLLGPPTDTAVLERSALGSAVHLRFESGASERWVHGVVDRFESHGVAFEAKDRHAFELRLVPRLATLRLRKNSRIFQDKTVPEIVLAIFAESGVSAATRLAKRYSKRVYSVQHQETDLAYVTRLLEEEGIFYFFEQAEGPAGSETVVLCDAAAQTRPIAGDPTLRIATNNLFAESDRDIRHFHVARAARPGRVTTREFDFERPSYDLHGFAKSSEEPEQYHHFAEIEPPAVGHPMAATRLDQHRRKAWTAEGETSCARLVPGFTFSVDDSKIPGAASGYGVLEVVHEGVVAATLRTGGEQKPPYRNRFRAIPGALAMRPRPPRPRTQQVLETATVVGPAGEEIYTDELGRIKVQFHWDREGRMNEHSSCWIRVMHAWSGAGWGFQFIPRIGMEVVVGFLAGDVDRPVILGAVNNAEHPASFPLPADKTKSGIRTNSTGKTGGHNEISFDDRGGDEALFIRAEKNMSERVGGDHALHVAGSRRESVEGAVVESTGADKTVTVAGHCRDRVTGDRSERTAGSKVVVVAGNADEIVTGHRSVEVTGASVSRFKGSASARVSQHAALTALGSLTVNVGAASAAPGTLHAKGPWMVSSDADVVIRAQKTVTIVCGTSKLTIGPESIQMVADAIDIRASDKATVRSKEALVELAKEARISAPATRLFGAAASVEASESAYMKGTTIKLGAREGDPPKAADTDATAPTRTISLHVASASSSKLSNRPYELTVDGVRYSGTTGGDGSISQSVPASATGAHLVVWEGAPPAGAQHSWNLSIAEPPAASTVEGARSRLQNLGFAVGTGDELDPVTAKSIGDFQRAQGLEETGTLDAATTAKLVDSHGH